MLYERGRYVEAEEQILAWLSENSDDSKALALLARVCANQGRLREALEWCGKAIAAEKVNAGSHYLRATILLEQGLLEEAGASLKRALYADQNFVLAHFVLGNLARQQGKFREAQKHFENALSLLRAYGREQVLPESEGITAGRLAEIINVQMDREGGISVAVLARRFPDAGAPLAGSPK
ncbi:MAG: tetratricopeptide repeat protein [Acidobacteria bacterium]|nr:tetratricopeptide repeat protein [Acidobacteriota bacterium]